jgi:ubiquitin-protein ligase
MNEQKSKKVLKKFKNRIDKEIKRNSIDSQFKFVAGDGKWYFKFDIIEGLYKGQTHIIESKLVYGASPDIYVYPIHPPLCRFVTPILHPNISDKGTICLDVLKDNWSPSMFSSSILSAIKLLLLNPDPTSPQNKHAAKLMLGDADEYKKNIKSTYENGNTCSHVMKMF